MNDETEELRAPSAIIEDGRRWGAGTWAFLAAGVVAVIALLAALTLWGFSSQATVDRLRAQVAREQGESDALAARYDDLWQQYQQLYEQALGSGLEPDTPDPTEVPDSAEAVPQRGEPGQRGEAGRQGLDGAPGEAGEPGDDGAPGAPGKDGAPGTPGRDGEDGSDGAPGTAGKDGAVGLTGATGMTGERGLPGRDGLDGKDGQQGPEGPPGPPGPTCPLGWSAETRYVLMAEEPLAVPTMQQATLCVATTTGGTP